MPNLIAKRKVVGHASIGNLKIVTYPDTSKKILCIKTGETYDNMEDLCFKLKTTKHKAFKRMEHRVEFNKEFDFKYL